MKQPEGKKETLLGGNARHGESQRFGNASQYRNDVTLYLVAQNGRKILLVSKIEPKSNTLNITALFFYQSRHSIDA
jgi:hypothetical protein